MIPSGVRGFPRVGLAEVKKHIIKNRKKIQGLQEASGVFQRGSMGSQSVSGGYRGLKNFFLEF